MTISSLLNVPRSEFEWSEWSWAHKDSHLRIIQAIRNSTGNIISIVTTSNGSGYTSAPAVTITDARGNGSGATATAQYVVSNNEYSIVITVVTQGSGYLEPVVTLSGGGGTGATAQAEYRPVTSLTEYQIEPINFNDFQTWLENNSQYHDDMNSFLGLQSSDLEELDLQNQNQLQNWIFLHWQEHQTAEAALKI